MLDRFCEHCCFVIILFFSKADQNQFLLELKVIEDKRRYISFSALFLTQVTNLFWLPAVLYTAEKLIKKVLFKKRITLSGCNSIYENLIGKL
jgi:hypothetical protein